MEYLPAGNLLDLLTDDDVSKLPIPLRHKFCRDIADGIRFLHGEHDGKRMVHGDLKLENILLSGNLVCKIADLGSAQISTITGLTSITNSSHATGHTAMYAAPEKLANALMESTRAADLYSFGVIVELILTRKSVRTTEPIASVLEDLKGNEDERNCKIIDLLGDLHVRACENDPKDRPTIAEVHIQLQSLDTPPDVLSACVTQVLEDYSIETVDSHATFTKPLKAISMPRIYGRGR